MKLKVETPPTLTGTADQQLRMVYSYLFRLAENLNVVLNSLGTSAAGTQTAAPDGGLAVNAYNELRALILHTAENIAADLSKLQADMEKRFSDADTGLSDFRKEVEEALEALEEHAGECTEHQIATDAHLERIDTALETLGTASETFAAYMAQAEQYIRYNKESESVEILCAGLSVNGQTLDEYILAVVNGERSE